MTNCCLCGFVKPHKKAVKNLCNLYIDILNNKHYNSIKDKIKKKKERKR